MRIILAIIGLTIVILTGMFIYNTFFFLRISVKFEDLEPFNGNIPVYYKGFKIGSSDKIPQNIKAALKTSDNKQYIKILYPDSPTVARLKQGNIIEGKYNKNLDNIIDDTLNGENGEDIMGSASNLMENANNTVTSLGNVFDEITGILQDIRPHVKVSVANIEKTTTHLSNVADNLDNALGRTPTKNSVDNIEATTENLKKMTSDLNYITTQIDEVSVPIINSILCDTNYEMKNTKEITHGIKCTLKKKMGMMKLFFGKPMDKCENCN